MSILSDMLKRLTDNYAKDPESNVGKLLNIAAQEIAELKETFDKIHSYKDIDQAVGTTLDRIGYNVQQWRGQATDPVYRLLIKSKIARNLSDGTINKIINILAVTLDTSPEDIRIIELYDDISNPEPAAIKLISIPLAQISQSGITAQQFGRMVQRTLAAGVRVSVIDLYGTFRFSSQVDASEFDEDFDDEGGFADLDQLTGGYLGAIYQPEDDIELPL